RPAYINQEFRTRQGDCGFPQSAIRNPQSAIRNPQSAIRNPQSAMGKSAIDCAPSVGYSKSRERWEVNGSTKADRPPARVAQDSNPYRRSLRPGDQDDRRFEPSHGLSGGSMPKHI